MRVGRDARRRSLHSVSDETGGLQNPTVDRDNYELAEWKVVRPNVDYHIEFDHHYYSVPYRLGREQLEVRATETTVEIKGNRESSFARLRPEYELQVRSECALFQRRSTAMKKVVKLLRALERAPQS